MLDEWRSVMGEPHRVIVLWHITFIKEGKAVRVFGGGSATRDMKLAYVRSGGNIAPWLSWAKSVVAEKLHDSSSSIQQ